MSDEVTNEPSPENVARPKAPIDPVVSDVADAAAREVTIEPVAEEHAEPVIDTAGSLVSPVEPGVPTISVDTAPLAPMPQVVERIVEKIVEKEVVKEVVREVPVERVVERVVEKVVHEPPTEVEIEAHIEAYLRERSKEGVAKKHALMLAKEEAILALAREKAKKGEAVRHADVMELLECSGRTATRLLHLLHRDGRLTLHGSETHPGYHSGHSAHYTLP